MGKTRKNLLIIQLSVAKYYRHNHCGFSVSELHQFMNEQAGENPVQKRTVRRCLNDLADVGFVKKKEMANSTLYVPDPALFPQPEDSVQRIDSEEVIVFNFSAD